MIWDEKNSCPLAIVPQQFLRMSSLCYLYLDSWGGGGEGKMATVAGGEHTILYILTYLILPDPIWRDQRKAFGRLNTLPKVT